MYCKLIPYGICGFHSHVDEDSGLPGIWCCGSEYTAVVSKRCGIISELFFCLPAGRSYCITSHRMLMQCIDSLVQKVQSGVVINFEKIGPDPPPVTSEGKKGFLKLCSIFFFCVLIW